MSVGNFTYQELDNSIYWAIRKTVEDLQYSPPINSYQPETPVNRAAFTAAIGALETSTNNKFIRVIGVGFSKKRGARRANTIYIDRISGVEGNVAHEGSYTEANLTGGQYSKYKVSGSTRELTYEVRLLTEYVEYERIIRNIIHTTFTTGRKYLPLLVDTNYTESVDKRYLIEFTGDITPPLTDFTEVVYTFKIIDVWVDDATTLDSVGATNGVTTVTSITIPQLIRVDGVGNTLPTQNDDIDLTN